MASLEGVEDDPRSRYTDYRWVFYFYFYG